MFDVVQFLGQIGDLGVFLTIVGNLLIVLCSRVCDGCGRDGLWLDLGHESGLLCGFVCVNIHAWLQLHRDSRFVLASRPFSIRCGSRVRLERWVEILLELPSSVGKLERYVLDGTSVCHAYESVDFVFFNIKTMLRHDVCSFLGSWSSIVCNKSERISLRPVEGIDANMHLASSCDEKQVMLFVEV